MSSEKEVSVPQELSIREHIRKIAGPEADEAVIEDIARQIDRIIEEEVARHGKREPRASPHPLG
jgi:hypothetical protein